MIDYEPFVCPNPEYDDMRVELAIDVKTMQGTVKAKIGEALFVFLDGVYVARKNEQGDAEMHCIQLPAEA